MRGRRWTTSSLDAGARQQRHGRRGDRGPGPQEGRAGLEVAPCRADRAAGLRPARGRGRRSATGRSRRGRAGRAGRRRRAAWSASTGTTASAPSGRRAPVAIRAAVPGSTVTFGRRAGRDVADDPQFDRGVLASRRRYRRRGSRSRPSPSSATAAARRAPTTASAVIRPRASAGGDRFRADRVGGGEDRVAGGLDAEQPRGRRRAHEPGSGIAARSGGGLRGAVRGRSPSRHERHHDRDHDDHGPDDHRRLVPEREREELDEPVRESGRTGTSRPGRRSCGRARRAGRRRRARRRRRSTTPIDSPIAPPRTARHVRPRSARRLAATSTTTEIDRRGPRARGRPSGHRPCGRARAR